MNPVLHVRKLLKVRYHARAAAGYPNASNRLSPLTEWLVPAEAAVPSPLGEQRILVATFRFWVAGVAALIPAIQRPRAVCRNWLFIHRVEIVDFEQQGTEI